MPINYAEPLDKNPVIYLRGVSVNGGQAMSLLSIYADRPPNKLLDS